MLTAAELTRGHVADAQPGDRTDSRRVDQLMNRGHRGRHGGERADYDRQARSGGSGRRSAADHSRRHARHLGAGERGGRRRRVRDAGQSCGRGGNRLAKGDISMSKVVVSNVKVLASGTRLDQQRTLSGEPIQSTVVTLLVTPCDGERIALCVGRGTASSDAAQSARWRAAPRPPAYASAALLGTPEAAAGTQGRHDVAAGPVAPPPAAPSWRSSRKSTPWKRFGPPKGPRRS